MAITYRYENHPTNQTDGFSQSLREMNDYFTQQGLNILGEGFKDVLTEGASFDIYKSKLLENLDARDEENLDTLMENARVTTLRENVSGIPPLTSLSMPTIRKMWAKIALKYAIPTQAVKLPSFSVSFSLPYIKGEKGKKHYLPEALKDNNNELAENKRLSEDAITLPATDFDLLGKVGCSVDQGDEVSNNFYVVEATMTAKNKSGSGDEQKEIKLNLKLDINRQIYGDVECQHSDGTVNKDTLFCKVNLEGGTITATSLKQTVKSIKIRGYVSPEAHNQATNIAFELKRRDIEIAAGSHIEASLPLEFLQDTMALYKIDAASELIDVMANVTAQKLDQEIYRCLEMSYLNNSKAAYTGEFDVYPSSHYNGNPTDWIVEIRRVIEFFANKLKTDTYYYTGYFVIVGNPLDTMLLPNVSWTFNNVTDSQNGIEVSYSVGAMSGSNKYTIVSSDLIPQGALTMFFVPTTDKFLTYKYYPYTFNVVQNYLNTQNTSVPSIMMTKRHTVEEFLPLIARITIKNNNGTLPK